MAHLIGGKYLGYVKGVVIQHETWESQYKYFCGHGYPHYVKNASNVKKLLI